MHSNQIVCSGSPLHIHLTRLTIFFRPNGSVFTVPAQNVHVAAQLGDVVTFSYESNSRRDAPVNPVVYRIRTDLDWDDLVLNYAKEKRHLSSITYEGRERRMNSEL